MITSASVILPNRQVILMKHHHQIYVSHLENKHLLGLWFLSNSRKPFFRGNVLSH